MKYGKLQRSRSCYLLDRKNRKESALEKIAKNKRSHQKFIGEKSITMKEQSQIEHDKDKFSVFQSSITSIRYDLFCDKTFSIIN